VDRIDEVTLPDGSHRIRIVDYKTGSTRLRPLQDLQAIFNPENIKCHSDYYLQAILYSCIYSQESELPISPCLLFIQHAGTEQYDPTLKFGKTPITDVNEIRDDFITHLSDLLNEIFNPSVPFSPTSERKRCKSCPFASLC